MVPAFVTAYGDYSTMFTSMFLHGGWLHLAGNMLFLWIFGDNMEDEMGHLPYLAFYIAGGLGAGLVHVMSDPTSPVPTVGASGAIAAVMGGYLLMFPKARVDILIIIIFYVRILPVPAFIMLGLWFGFQLLSGVTADLSGGGVAYWAHAGGFLVGIVLTLPLFLRRGGTSYWSRTEGHPPHPEARYKFVKSNIPVVRRK
jgi:membrane associated rhomboid family serine protease